LYTLIISLCIEVALSTTIKEAAAGTGLQVGTKIQAGWNRSVDLTQIERYPAYESIVLREFDLATINSCNPRWDIGVNLNTLTVPDMESQLDFTNCDYMLQYVRNQSLAFRVHVLNYLRPQRHVSLLDDTSFTVEQKTMFLKEYTKVLLRRIGSDVDTVVVINELMEEEAGGGLRNFIDGVNTETEMPTIACDIFKAAREAKQELICGTDSNGNALSCDCANDPSRIRLIYQDYGHSCMAPCNNTFAEAKDKSGRIYNFVKDLVDQDCGITTVGFQMHINRHYRDFDGLRRNIQRYADIGIAVHFTEVDVKCGWTCDSGTYCCGLNMTDPDAAWTQDMLTEQGYVYSQILTVCLEEPNCEAFVFWDTADGIAPWSSTLPPQNPYLWDINFQNKTAFQSVIDTLQNFPRDHSAIDIRTSGSWRNTTCTSGSAGSVQGVANLTNFFFYFIILLIITMLSVV